MKLFYAMKFGLRLLLVLLLTLLLTQCETMETVGGGATVTVQGTQFYPDESGLTYIVPEGAQIIGAGGTQCHYIVKKGGSIVSHSGVGNTYKIEAGGHFRGFVHPAKDCTVTFEAGALVEQEETGPGTRFVKM